MAFGSLCSCNQEPLPTFRENDQILMLSPTLLELQDGNVKTRALSADELKDDQYNENKVSRLDVFIFKADGTSAKIYHLSDLTPSSIVHHGNLDGYLLSSDWRNDGLIKGVNYKVYVIANSTNENITGANTMTEAALKAEATVDGDIYKLYKEGVSDITYSSDKTFLMNATVASWSINDDDTQVIGGQTLLLERAAVKFVMDVSLGDRLIAKLAADEREYGTPNWKFINFNTVTSEVPEGTVPEEQLLNSPSGNAYYLKVVPGTEDGHFIVTTYAYPQTWANKSATVTIDGNEVAVNNVGPALLVSYPAYDKDAQTPHYHYYYIPLCDYKTITSTQRNKIYKVNAVISSYGSFETLSNDPVSLTYEVKDWVGAEAEVNAYATDYILATPSHFSFKGGKVNEELNQIVKYYASGNVTISGKRAYYINKTGDTTTVTTGFNVGEPSNGQIEITSTVPTNGTYRTVEFTVNCGEKSQKVIFRHYPADYVTGISGSWSSYEFNGWAVYGSGGKNYNSSSFTSGTFYFGSSTSDSFTAHVYYNGGVHYLNTNGGEGDSAGSDLTNNQMYVLQITAANDNYIIGYPQLDKATAHVYYDEPWSWTDTDLGTVEYATSKDNVLSPAFMLGSQLGANRGFSTQEASAIHCALYKEVATDGKVYTGWRLPTKQEVQYMIDNQNNDVMIEVLGGKRYWTLDGGYAIYPAGDDGDGSQIWTRCVRDLLPEDIAKLNQF